MREVMTIEANENKTYCCYLIVKRIIDVLISVVLLILSSPILLLAGIAIKLTSRGPVIFKQKRAGQYGKIFTMLKLRTMTDDVENHKSVLNDPNGQNGPAFKLKDDPRITPVGKILRKTSIDELPQLINVIKGDMSIVGPRPLPLSQVKFDTLAERMRLTVKPGITGLWQVSGRADIPYEEWIKLDLYYIEHRGIVFDFWIMLKTIPAVIFGKGAY